MRTLDEYNEETVEDGGQISFVILRNGDGRLVSRKERGPITAKEPGLPKQDLLNLPPLFISYSLFHEPSSPAMAPTNLQGLNIVHPAIHADAHDLLAGQQYSDLSAQLDLWTNLTFDSEEPLRPNDGKYSRKSPSEEDEEEVRSPVTTEKAVHDGHINVVTGTNIGTNEASRHGAPSLPAFDLNTFLAGFGIDPFALPPPQQQPIAPSLAQLLAFHSAAAVAQHLPPPPSFGAQPHLQIQPPSGSSHSLPSFRSTHHDDLDSEPPSPGADNEELPASKRARTRKASISTVASPEADLPASSNMSAAEDKRRRNTAASARFRLKKKEREAALEGKAKELEQKVSELERECEGLRRENGWLKGLVVGVTGAAQGPVPPPLNSQALQNLTSSSSGSKRRRDDGENA